ncbi:DUF296 domain-containing protein [Candidatus Heimdallarchaeota archaeon]|nr:MAG: DUF296 domain-containing protein [Candidatus Gerdarchaeota archaeon]RLI69525.1 MAG: DUF296 domain-containing protein [Candidatus Gerdarchaeota archaeon]RLI74012.1 MAG: DUF296 domain-containing protein [Candidatus Heimdallarchaeota archaeon]
MKSMKMDTMQVYLLRLEKGEELLTTIKRFVKEHNICAGYLTGIGALEKGTIGYFDTEAQKYVHTPFQKVELISCMGNIAKDKDTGEPVIHAHILLGKKDGSTLGGHLVEGFVSVTTEIYLVETRPPVFRIKDSSTGLYLLSPKN